MIKIFKKKKKSEEAVASETGVTGRVLEEESIGIFKKLKDGLSNTSSKISDGITDIFTKRKLDSEALEQLEELLISSDLGPVTSMKIVEAISKDRFDKEVTDIEIKEALATEVEAILSPTEKQFEIDESKKPFVVLMVGVNGTGKTTSIGKMAYQLKAENKKVMFAAGDTFRAAAVAQLGVWAERLGMSVVSKAEGSDPAALVYEAIDKAIEENIDVLFIDTAGRLQNKEHLMEELKKVDRVIKKKLADAPHETIISLDATVGQNAHSQVELFSKAVDLTGMIVTKLDGTAKGGVIVSLAEKFKYPIYAVGVGEKVEDLRNFRSKDFSRILVGLE